MGKDFKVVSVGEMLWDMFPDGAKFGGAPANVACHCAALLGHSYIISSAGRDCYGERAVEFLAYRGVDVSCVSISDKYPTGTVDVTVDDNGKPDYIINCDVAWDNIVWDAGQDALVKNADAVCFGSLAQRGEISRRTITRLLEAASPECLKVFDVNLRQNYFDEHGLRNSIMKADVLKLNDEELPVIAGIFNLSGSILEIARELVKTCGLKLAALTRGGAGAIIVSIDDVSDFSGTKVDNIVDTVGAGDSFTAALIAGILRNKTLEEINRNACKLAAYVCSQAGATPQIPDKFKLL